MVGLVEQAESGAMTELQDPIELYRQSLANAPKMEELHPPTFERVEVLPYPDLSRLWARVQISPFSSYPDLGLTLVDPDGNTVSTLFVVEARQPYQSFTLHLRQPPRAGDLYHLEIELSRGGEVLDVRRVDFPLTFKEPADGHSE
jgi:hypothetical protein